MELSAFVKVISQLSHQEDTELKELHIEGDSLVLRSVQSGMDGPSLVVHIVPFRGELGVVGAIGVSTLIELT